MGGGNHKNPSPAANKHRSATSSSKPNTGPSPKPTMPKTFPSNKPDPTHSNLPPFPFSDPPPPPSYGFHMLHRLSVVLADGSVRSYFALPPDYHDFPPFPIPESQLATSPDFRVNTHGGRGAESWAGDGPGHRLRIGSDHGPGHGSGIGSGNEVSMKRKYVDEERQRQQLLQYGSGNGGPGVGQSRVYRGPGGGPSNDGGGYRGDGDEVRGVKMMKFGGEGNGGRSKRSEVDQGALKKVFFHFVKVVFENGNQKKKYLDGGRKGHLSCLACQRSSKDFPDMHSLVMHAYNPESAGSLVDHLGFHKALCILMGWNFLMPPDISKLYQKLPPDQAAANQDDLILWPPSVIIHNTITGRGRDGKTEGLRNRVMDNKLRDLGFSSGKSKALYSRDGHLGITLVKFASDDSGLKEAIRLAHHFEKDGLGRTGWAQVPSSSAGKDDESNPRLVKVDPRTGERNRILYGYLATVMDMDTVDFETRKKVTIENRRDHR